MLARNGAAQVHRQARDAVGNHPHPLHVRRDARIQHRPGVKVRVARVPIDGGLGPVLFEHRAEAPDERHEFLGRDRDVLDERQDAARPGKALEDLDGALAHLPKIFLFLRVVRVDGPERQPQFIHHQAANAGDEGFVLGPAVGELLHQQDRVGLFRQELLRDNPLRSDDVQKVPLHDLARARPETQNVMDRLARLLQVREPEEHAGPLARFRHDAQARLDDDGQRPFGTHDEARQVQPPVAHGLEEVVTGAVLARVRLVSADEVGVLRDEPARPRRDLSEQVAARFRLRRPCALEGHRFQPHLGPIREHHVQVRHVLLRRAVPHVARPGGVAAEVAPDGAKRFARRVGPEHQSARGQRLVHLSGDGAGLNAHDFPLRVDLQDAVHVLRKVQDDAAPERLAREARPGAACDDRHAEFARDPHRRRHVRRVLRHDDGERHDAVDAGGRRIGRQADPVRQHVAADLPVKRLPDSFGKRAVVLSLGQSSPRLIPIRPGHSIQRSPGKQSERG